MLLTLPLFFTFPLSAQIQSPKTPETQKFNSVNPSGNTLPQNKTPNFQQNQSNSTREYERLKEELKQDEARNKASQIQYDFASHSNLKGTELYYKSFAKIETMLSGNVPPSLQKAVCDIENAWFDGKLDQVAYDHSLDKMANDCRALMQSLGLDSTKNKDKIFALFRYMTDTVSFKEPKTGKISVSYPFGYDFDDFTGERDYSNTFVTKLIRTRKGQCHSLPLLFLILCEKLDAEAFIAYAPNHTFIKFKDGQQWVGIELTRGMLVSDAAIVASGYITTTAIRNNVYLAPSTQTQLLASMLGYLAEGYENKFGPDPFSLRCYNAVLESNPTNPFALMSKANYHSYQLMYILKQTNNPPPTVLQSRYPQGFQVFQERNKDYQKIDDLGIVMLTNEQYQAWLKNLK